MKNSYVYGYVKLEGDRKIYIGYKSPDGEDFEIYTASSSSEDFIKDRSLGLLHRVVLYEGDDATAKALEWFALDYAVVNKNELFYNKVNSAHKSDQTLLTKDMKKVVVDFIEGNGMGLEEEKDETLEEHANRIEALAQDVLDGKYDQLIKYRKTSDLMNIRKSQVRVFENAGRDRVQMIATRMNENPQKAREIFKPATLVKEKEGEMIVDGISRTTAANITPGWDDIPTITLDTKLFGKTKQERLVGYKVFGGYMNKEDFEVRTTNTDDDIKNQWQSIIRTMNLDLSKPLHREKARETCFVYYKSTVPSAKKRQGLWKSLINDFENEEIENLYKDKKLKIYTEQDLNRYEFKKYGVNGVATIVTTMGKYKECVGYILRRMKNMKTKKGAIIMYHSNFKEVEQNKNGELVQDVQETINWMNLCNSITVEILPTYSTAVYED
jgi:hypothetical protein